MSHTCFLRFGRVYDPMMVIGPLRGNGSMYDRGAFRKHNLDGLPVVVDHDMDRKIGVVRQIVDIEDTDGTWWAALCDVPEPPAWLKPGTGVSFAFRNLHRAQVNGWDVVRDALLDEVSVLHLMHPDDKGARVLTLRRAEPSPSPARKVTTSDRAAAGEVIHHREQAISGNRYQAEIHRRLEWAERCTGREADLDAVIKGMRRELYGPTIDELYAETIGSRVAA